MRPRCIELPDDLDQLLTALARHRRSTRSDVLREAIEAFARQTPNAPVAVLGAGLIGSVQDAPSDLSTNLKHMEGYGEPGPGKAPRKRPPRRTSLAKLFADSPLKGINLKCERD